MGKKIKKLVHYSPTGKRSNKILPDKLWKLLALAVRDMQEVLKKDEYILQMDRYHSVDDKKKKCVVCMAGAVLANTIGYPFILDYYIYNNSLHIKDAQSILSIDSMRVKDFVQAYRNVYKKEPSLEVKSSLYSLEKKYKYQWDIDHPELNISNISKAVLDLKELNI